MGQYIFSENCCNKADFNFQFAEVRYKAEDLRQTIKTKAAFVNGYYDISSYKSVIPYLTVGIGVGHNSAGYLNMDGENVCKGKDKTNFIWNAGIGAVFKSNRNLAIDLGYKYIDLGHTKANNGANIFERAGTQRIKGHQILGSLIYSF